MKNGRTDVRTTDGQMDRYMDVQSKTIIPHHYSLAGYNKYKIEDKE